MRFVCYLLYRRVIIRNSPFTLAYHLGSCCAYYFSILMTLQDISMSLSISYFGSLFLQRLSLLRVSPSIYKVSAPADFETLMLSCYETALLTLWHSRRGQGVAVRARKSRLHERVNISLTRPAIYTLHYSPVVFIASQTFRVT